MQQHKNNLVFYEFPRIVSIWKKFFVSICLYIPNLKNEAAFEFSFFLKIVYVNQTSILTYLIILLNATMCIGWVWMGFYFIYRRQTFLI